MSRPFLAPNPKPVPGWAHLGLGLAAVVGAAFAASGIAAFAVPPLAVGYVAWTARRPAGLLLALAAGLVELQARDGSLIGVITTTSWFVVYVAIAVVVAAIEVATRPPTRRVTRGGSAPYRSVAAATGGAPCARA